jgi:hypothetical protein
MAHVLLVGQKLTSLSNYLTAHGYTYTFLQDRAKTKFPDKKFKHRVLGDFSDKNELLGTVDAIPHHINGAMTTYENYILPTAWITNHLNLPGLSIQTAKACTDKFLMRSLFDKAPEKISPAFAMVSSEQDVRDFASAHAFPLILKPANLAKSLLVTKNDTMDELIENYRRSTQLLETTYKKYAPHRTPQLLIEEFLEGSIHSVDAFVDHAGTPYVLDQVVDYQTGYDIGYSDNFHYSRLLPSALSEEDQAALRHCADVGIRALGMKNSPAHVEIIMTKNGPRIVEIGARNGGYRERMHDLANGIDITGAALSLVMGTTPQITAKKEEPCAVLELFPRTPGVFEGIENIEMLRALKSLTYLSIKTEEGQFVGKAADGYKMCAIIILHYEDTATFNRDLQAVNDTVYVKTAA